MRIQHKNKISALLTIFCLLLFSCETKTDWDLKTDDISVIVVDGLITNQVVKQSVRISKTIDNQQGLPVPASGAIVSIDNGTTEYQLTELANTGVYESDSTFAALFGKQYHIQIQYNNKEYFASTEVMPVTFFDTLQYSFNEDTGMFRINYVAEQYNTEAAMYKIDINWENVAGFDSIDVVKKKASLYYYSLPSIDVNELFSPDKEPIYFPAGAEITETKYSLTSQHAGFIRSLLAETEWRGGFFDVAPGNVPTNLSEGAVGFFGASSTVTIQFIAR